MKCEEDQKLNNQDYKLQIHSFNSEFKSVIQLFKQQVERAPNSIAILFEEKQLTYQELDLYSDQIALYLKDAGILPETLVGFSSNSHLHLITGILGILKSGGVYLPLDPTYPAERLESMLNDASPKVLLVQSDLMSKFPAFTGKLLQWEEIWNEISSIYEKDNQWQSLSKPNHLAYIVYTSGSTGKPKGIMVTQESFSHAAQAHKEHYPKHIKALLLGAISFDVSILTIFHTLVSGGTLCLPSKESILEINKLEELIEKHSLNFLLCVPSFYAMLLKMNPRFLFLENISLAGENIPGSLPLLHAQCAPNAVLYNEYGPSEYAIGTTLAKVYDPCDRQVRKMAIGKPLPDTKVYILDEDLKPLPLGEKGEIFIGGAGLARGYLNHPSLTAQKFIWVASLESEPIRLYKTGDFGRFLPSGDIEFLGRIDHQIKIRGHRVELGEIEYTICQYPGIDEAVVIAKEDASGNFRLIAYFSRLSNPIETQHLRNHLSKILPQHMLPAFFMEIQTFPRTPNGKINREVLPDIPAFRRQFSDDNPQSEWEKTLSAIWKEILKTEQIGVHDNFFEVGGDSLQLICMQAMIETKTDAKVHVVDLFQYPTISQLAQHLSQQKIQAQAGMTLTQNISTSEKRKAVLQRLKKQRVESEL